jgi:hypothetical protein
VSINSTISGTRGVHVTAVPGAIVAKVSLSGRRNEGPARRERAPLQRAGTDPPRRRTYLRTWPVGLRG